MVPLRTARRPVDSVGPEVSAVQCELNDGEAERHWLRACDHKAADLLTDCVDGGL
jgi:hypothetical protein